MKKSNFVAAAIVAASLLFTACKKTEGPQGPTGPQGSSGVVTTSTDGFIKGTLTGTHRDGSAINETFNFPNFWVGPACSLDSSSFGGFSFSLARGTDILSSNVSHLTINTSSLTNFSSATASMDFTYEKAITSTKLFSFNANSFNPTISGVTYNKTTGQLTGSFTATISGFNNNTGNTATISGTFQSSVTQLYYRMAHH